MTAPETAVEVVASPAVALLRRDGEAARDFARESLSPATRRAYQTDVDAFMTWCRRRGAEALPAEPEVVAAFLAHEAERGLRASTVARRASGMLATEEYQADSDTLGLFIAECKRGRCCLLPFPGARILSTTRTT